MTVLVLGCGWSSLTLYIAESYLHCKITGLSNSWTQPDFIERQTPESGYNSVKIMAGDVQNIDRLDSCSSFDLVMSAEMFKYMNNYGALLAKTGRWMKAKGKPLAYFSCHKSFIYNFETESASNCLVHYFFTSETVMSDDKLCYFKERVKVVDR